MELMMFKMNYDNIKLVALVPCYNEEISIADVISALRKELPEAIIYVFDNNSSDRTSEIARSMGVEVVHVEKRGKGNVIRRMFRSIEADYYFVVDGDNTYSLKNIRKMVELAIDQDADMVIGDRLSTTYFTQNKRPFHNFGNRLVRSLINYLFDSNVKDVMTGMRLMNRRFVKNCQILSNNFEVETEITIYALNYDFRLLSVPVEYTERTNGSVSKLNTFSDGFNVILTIIKMLAGYRPFSFFSFISCLLLCISIYFFIPVFIEYLNTGLVPRFPTLIASGFLTVIALLFFFSGIILNVMLNYHRCDTEVRIKNTSSLHK